MFCLQGVSHTTFHNVTEKRMTWFLWLGAERQPECVCHHTCLKKTFDGRHFESHLFKRERDHCHLLCWGLEASPEWLSESRVPVLNLVPQDTSLLTQPSLCVHRKSSILSLSSWLCSVQVVKSHSVINELMAMESIAKQITFRPQRVSWNSERENYDSTHIVWTRLDRGHFYFLRL